MQTMNFRGSKKPTESSLYKTSVRSRPAVGEKGAPVAVGLVTGGAVWR